jgi:hypothetical protein
MCATTRWFLHSPNTTIKLCGWTHARVSIPVVWMLSWIGLVQPGGMEITSELKCIIWSYLLVLSVERQRRFWYNNVTRACCHYLVVLSVLIGRIKTTVEVLNAPREKKSPRTIQSAANRKRCCANLRKFLVFRSLKGVCLHQNSKLE